MWKWRELNFQELTGVFRHHHQGGCNCMNVLEHMVDGLVEHLQQYFDILFSEKKKNHKYWTILKYVFIRNKTIQRTKMYLFMWKLRKYGKY